jgi:hypothetical protein
MGVAITIAFLSKDTLRNDPVAGFNHIWIVVVAGGVITTLFSLLLRRKAR